MSESTARSPPAFWHSVARTLVTHYWPFTVVVLAFVTIGMALAPRFDAGTALVLLASVWITLEGFHAIDLADPELTLDVDSRVQRTGGYLQVLVGGAVATWLAWQTTVLLFACVVAAVVLGLAYNEEWFGGLFHDRDRITGLANFGFVWGSLPVVAGYVTLAGGLGLGVAFVALGCGIFSVTLNMLEGPAREARYEDLGIEHDREADATKEELARTAHRAQVLNAGTFAAVAIGLLVRYGPL